MQELMIRGGCIILGVLALTACGILPGPPPTQALNTSIGGLPPSPGTPSPEANNDAPPTEAPTYAGPGGIVVIGHDGNLYLLTAGREPFALTDDARSQDGSDGGLLYNHPTWSPNGWLSYVRLTTGAGQPARLDVYAARPEGGLPIRLLTTDEHNYIYGAWSPAACGDGADCGRFAFLMGEPPSLTLHLAQVSSNASVGQDEIIARAQPFYFSWASDGESMLWFQNARQLSIYDLAAREVREELPDIPGLFQAPAWSPTDQRLLFAYRDDEDSQIVVMDGEQRGEVSRPVSGAVYFSWSPDGGQIAYANGSFPLSSITVVDADDGSERVLDEVGNVVSFFWSPDSRRIAVVSVERGDDELRQGALAQRRGRRLSQEPPDEVVLVWWSVDVATGEADRLASFRPTLQQIYLLQFFDQYAQSHRVWSPDSRYIVYAEQITNGEPGLIRLLDTHRPDMAPLTLMEGGFAVFSFE